MKKFSGLFFLLFTQNVIAQNPITIPDTLTGVTFNLNMHTDSVQFFPGRKTFTNAFNQFSYLGTTLILNKGENVTMNVTDNLGDTTTVHWHGLHVPSMDDGGPHIFILDGNTWSPQFTVMNHALHEDDGMMGQFVVVPNTTSINEFPANAIFSVFPNPATQFISIDGLPADSKSITVTNTVGQKIFYQNLELINTKLTLNTMNWKSGIYFITLITFNHSSTQKISITN